MNIRDVFLFLDQSSLLSKCISFRLVSIQRLTQSNRVALICEQTFSGSGKFDTKAIHEDFPLDLDWMFYCLCFAFVENLSHAMHIDI